MINGEQTSILPNDGMVDKSFGGNGKDIDEEDDDDDDEADADKTAVLLPMPGDNVVVIIGVNGGTVCFVDFSVDAGLMGKTLFVKSKLITGCVWFIVLVIFGEYNGNAVLDDKTAGAESLRDNFGGLISGLLLLSVL